jgi:hypothetical protein
VILSTIEILSCLKRFLPYICLLCFWGSNTTLLLAQTEPEQNFFLFEGTRDEVLTAFQRGDIRYFRQTGEHSFVVDKNPGTATGGRLKPLSGYGWKMTADPSEFTGAEFVYVQVVNVETFLNFCHQQGWSASIKQTDTLSRVVRLHLGKMSLQDLLQHPLVTFIAAADAAPQAEAEVTLNDLTVNRINKALHAYPLVPGDGMMISVKERAVDAQDIDLLERVTLNDLTDSEQSLHATQMATLIAGAGNSSTLGAGIAPYASITSSSFLNLLPDDPTTLNNLGVTIQNHSYGTGIENVYGAEAAAYDAHIASNPERVHVFSSGNSGLVTSTAGPYAGVEGLANLTGNMKMAKNIILVGAHDQQYVTDDRSSRGPTYDGRLAPHLVAYGPGGTSDGAAIVSGTVALMQQRYQDLYDALPSVALIKSVLAVTTDDVGTTGPDYKTGFGALNADRAIRCIESSQAINETLIAGETWTYEFNLTVETPELRIALSWVDPPAAAGSTQALTHDLNLLLEQEGAPYARPWILSAYPHVDSLNLPSRRGVDTRNNVEYLSIKNPPLGTYKLKVSAGTLTTPSQDFSCVWWAEPSNTFEWTFPLADEVAEATSSIQLRWNSPSTETAQLEVSIDGGNWEIISDQVELSSKYYTWEVPSGFHAVQFRMKRGETYDVSDVMYTSPAIPVQVALNCDDQAILSWDRVAQATQYRVMKVGERYLQLYTTTTDTAVLVNKNVESARYFSVIPVRDGHAGFRSYSYNYESQGVGCYYENFLGSEVDGKGELNLSLSTLYNIASVAFEKRHGNSFVALGAPITNLSEQISITDEDLQGGVSQYRARINLLDNGVVYSDTIQIFYGDRQSYFVFPNPVNSGENITLLTDGDNLTFVMFDRMGRQVFEQAVFGELYRIPLAPMQSGFYIYQFRRGGKITSSGRLLIR